jgi:glycosyltransferase involved in cell wall biosynthesis
MVTSEWPTPERPEAAPFIFRSVEFLRRAGVDVDVLPFRGARRLSNYSRAWRAVRDRTSTGKYDLVHAQFGQSGLVALPRSSPLVVTFRGDDLEGITGDDGRYTLAGKVLQLVSRTVAQLADEVIVVSESLARRLPRRAYHVIPSGVDLELFRPFPSAEARRQLGMPPDRYLVLFSGGVDQDRNKRHWLAQAAVTRLSRTHEAELVLVNGVPHDRMPLYMNACDALLLASIHEGSPNVVKEALACNLPVVSTDVGDVRKRLDGLDGCAIVGDEPEEVCAGLKTVLGRGRLAAGRQAVAGLDEAVLTDRLIGVYEQAMSARKHSRAM